MLLVARKSPYILIWNSEKIDSGQFASIYVVKIYIILKLNFIAYSYFCSILLSLLLVDKNVVRLFDIVFIHIQCETIFEQRMVLTWATF
jgi:hypothetical protein